MWVGPTSVCFVPFVCSVVKISFGLYETADERARGYSAFCGEVRR